MRKQPTTPDKFFTNSQIQRLTTLMQRWRTVLALEQELPLAEQTELEELVKAELQATSVRATIILNDTALLKAAQATLSSAQHERMEALHHKLQREGLTEEEKAEADSLEQQYLDVVLIRANAAQMLQNHDYDISNPTHFIPRSHQY